MIYATRNVLGIFALDGEGNLLEFIPFSGSPSQAGRKLVSPEPVEEEKELVKKHPRVSFESTSPHQGGEKLRSRLDLYLKEVGVSREEYNLRLREVCFFLAREGARAALTEKDRVVIEAVKTLDELNETLNLLSERLRSWYSLHYPELSFRVKGHEEYARLIAEKGGRDSIAPGQESIGMDFSAQEEEAVKRLAQNVRGLYLYREEVEEFLEEELKSIAPNLHYLIGATLAARLISLAGGLRALAFMPASRIQLLGAEKALFRHLKKKARPPKHGIIFQLPEIKSSPRKLRGRISRRIAAILAQAARIDAFTGKFRGEELGEKMQARLEEVRG